MNASQPRTKRRLLPRSLAGKAAAAGLSGVLLLIGMYFVAVHYAAQRLAEAWTLSDEFGLSNDVETLLGPTVPPERNFAVPLDQAAAAAFSFMQTERSKWKAAGDPLDDPLAFPALERFAVEPEYNARLAEADVRAEYHSPVVIQRPYNLTLMPYLQTRRELAHVERGIARRLASVGKREEAARRLLRMARVTRRWEDREPFMITTLVNITVRLVVIDELNIALRRGGPLPAAVHDEIDREMAACENVLRLVPFIGQFEKIVCVGDYEAFSPLGVTPLLRPLIDNDRAYMLQYMHRWAKTADRPLHEAKGDLDALDQEIRGIAGDRVRRLMYIGSVMNLPAVNQMRYRLDRLIAVSRCLRVVNAMARRNDFQAPLESLGLPKDCLVDPFDGQPLRIKQTSTGPIVYSIDDNFLDDGGQVRPTAGVRAPDYGLGPPLDPVKP